MRNKFKTTKEFNGFMKFKGRYAINKLTVQDINDLFRNKADLYLVQSLDLTCTTTLYTSYESAYKHIKQNFTRKDLMNYITAYDREYLELVHGYDDNLWSYTTLIDNFIEQVEAVEDFFEVAFDYNKENN